MYGTTYQQLAAMIVAAAAAWWFAHAVVYDLAEKLFGIQYRSYPRRER